MFAECVFVGMLPNIIALDLYRKQSHKDLEDVVFDETVLLGSGDANFCG